MIAITVKTERVYSHGTDGMPKIEVINQKLMEGAEFDKFLKYLPYHGYINSKVKVIKAYDTKSKEDVPHYKYQRMIDGVVEKLEEKPKTIHDDYENEKAKNDELMKLIEKLEALVGGKQELEEEKLNDKVELTELRAKYQEKFGKKPFAGWDEEKLKEKLEDADDVR